MDASQRRSAFTSAAIHGLFVVLLLGLAGRREEIRIPVRAVPLHLTVLKPYASKAGGGGQRTRAPASAGHLPPRARRQFVPPIVKPANVTPKLPMVATLDLPPDLRDSKLLDVGDPSGLGKIFSGGTGGPEGIGDGRGNRVGPESGAAAGPSGVFSPGHGVTMPVALHKVEPEFSEEARKAHAMGTVVVYVEIGPDGKPHNLRITRSFGMGLDEKALEAVSQWLFRPGTRDGKPVTVSAQIEVSSHLL